MRQSRSVKSLARHLANVARTIRKKLQSCIGHETPLLAKLNAFWKEHLQVALTEHEIADATAQVMVIGKVMSAVLQHSEGMEPRHIRTVIASCELEPFVPEVEAQKLQTLLTPSAPGQPLPFATTTDCLEPIPELIEQFLSLFDQETRKRRGAYYTPMPVAQFVVRSVDALLRHSPSKKEDLTNQSNWHHDGLLPSTTSDHCDDILPIQILDPAAGSGVFLLATIDFIYARFVDSLSQTTLSANQLAKQWNSYVDSWLLPALSGYEIMPAVAMMANDLIATKLVMTGYRHQTRLRSVVRVHNPLEGPTSEFSIDPNRLVVVLSNPPFSGISNNNSDWIKDLLRGNLKDQQVSNYYTVDGEPLTERKVWLQDDYVKFFRYAQWLVESHTGGVLGFITNHGYLENISFRGMRQSLLEAFPEISIIDVHGSRKKHETDNNGNPDENIFDIEQGIAIGFFSKLPRPPAKVEVTHGDLWGSRQKKISLLNRTISRQLVTHQLAPEEPNYFLYPHTPKQHDTYDRSPSLVEVMPFYRSAVVTARDSFVVASDREKLVERIRRFRDLSISNEEIRTQYFTNSRSQKYPAGDTRGWKLAAARQKVADDVNWQHRLTPCAYRPWDNRWIYWADWMIDWPRNELATQILNTPNQLLIARRQMPRHQPCNYFWTCNTVAIDGVIRSDNRGNESLFPLYIYHDTGTVGHGERRRQGNFADWFIDQMSSAVQAQWTPDGEGDLRETIGPENLFHYIYATFHSTDYRSRYAERLQSDFPRVIVHPEKQVVVGLCRLGKQLVQLHCLRGASQNPQEASWQLATGSVQVAKGFPRYKSQRIYTCPSQWVGPVTEDIWEHRIGIHQVCHKWLKDRRQQNLTHDDQEHYLHILSGIAHTFKIVRELNSLVDKFGGWEPR